MNLLISTVRTLVPVLIGWVVSILATVGIDVPQSIQDWLYGLILFLVALVWYLIVRALEARWPKLGILLGVPSRPVYQAVGSVADPVTAPEDPDADVKVAA